MAEKEVKKKTFKEKEQDLREMLKETDNLSEFDKGRVYEMLLANKKLTKVTKDAS